MAENANGLSEALVTDKPILVKNPFSKSSFDSTHTHTHTKQMFDLLFSCTWSTGGTEMRNT